MLRKINTPPEAREIGDQFQFVLLWQHNGDTGWVPALLTAWIRLPDHTWACRVQTPRYRATGGYITQRTVYAYDPAVIRQLTAADIRTPDAPPSSQPYPA